MMQKKLLIKHKKRALALLVTVTLLFSAGMFGQNPANWLGSYSSEDFEEKKVQSATLYYYWQIESLIQPVSPRYIRMVDIEGYTQNNDLLQKGILVTYNGLRKSEVEVCTDFLYWQCKPMRRNRFGIYYTMLSTPEIKRGNIDNFIMEYKFRVDGFFENDPVNTDKIEDGSGSFISRYVLESSDPDKFASSTVLSESSEQQDLKTVEFSIYLPEATTVSVAGNFNHWDHENDFLKKEQRTGIFRLRKKLKSGEYYYYYIVDGEIKLDVYNPETRLLEETNEIASYLNVSDEKKSIRR